MKDWGLFNFQKTIFSKFQVSQSSCKLSERESFVRIVNGFTPKPHSYKFMVNFIVVDVDDGGGGGGVGAFVVAVLLLSLCPLLVIDKMILGTMERLILQFTGRTNIFHMV